MLNKKVWLITLANKLASTTGGRTSFNSFTLVPCVVIKQIYELQSDIVGAKSA